MHFTYFRTQSMFITEDGSKKETDSSQIQEHDVEA